MTFKKILTCTDFSPPADQAFRTAVDVSLRYGAALTIVHVYEPATYALPEGHMLYTPLQLKELTEAFERRLAHAKVEAEAAAVESVETKLLVGSASGEITEFAAQHGFDLIALGTHGRRGITRLLLGSVAEKVVRAAPCPVLTVRLRETRASGTESRNG